MNTFGAGGGTESQCTCILSVREEKIQYISTFIVLSNLTIGGGYVHLHVHVHHLVIQRSYLMMYSEEGDTAHPYQDLKDHLSQYALTYTELV